MVALIGARTLLPEVHARCKQEGRRFPESSTLFFMWTAVEDVILHAWLDYILQHPVSHVSLHFDGLRVAEPLPLETQALCSQCEDHILKATGFAVRIRPKVHLTFFDQINAKVTNQKDSPPRSDIWFCPGNASQ